MNITIYSEITEMEDFYKGLLREYEKRLSKDCRITLRGFDKNEAPFPSDDTKHYAVAIHPQAPLISSEDFAQMIGSVGLKGFFNLSFYPFPFENADRHFSLSRFSLSPPLLAVLLYEQIYRAYRILGNAPYHK